MKIWRIHTPSDQLGYPFSASHEEVQYYLDIFDKFYKGVSVAEIWKPTMICRLHEVDIGRLVQGSAEFLVLTEKAKKLLAPLLKTSVEYLPSIPREKSHKKISNFRQITRKKIYQPIIDTVHAEQQYVINILDIKTIKVIDFEQSECEYDEESGIVSLVNRLAFKPQLIKDNHLFKIDNSGIDLQNVIFISDEFKMIVEKNNLKGLNFAEQPEDEKNLVWQTLQS